MQRINWFNAAAYGVFTAVSLGMVLWFARFVSERTGAITWTLLVVGLCAAAAILLYVVLRWFTSSLLRETAAVLMQRLGSLGRRFETGASEPVTREEIRAVQGDIEAIAPLVIRLVGIALTTMLLMGLLLELVTLANGAVMYLQAKRIEEQNQLLGAQNRGLDASFLNDSLNNVRTISQNIDTTASSAADIESNFISPFGILDLFVPEMTDNEVRLHEYTPVVCADSSSGCAGMTFGAFLANRDTGRIGVTSVNRNAVRAYYRLSRAVEVVGLAFTSNFGEQDSSFNDRVDAGSRLLADATAICGGTEGGRAILLWKGISGAFLAATEMWPVTTANDVRAGGTLKFARPQDFLGLGAGLGYLAQTLDRGDTEVMAPKEVAELFGSALGAFEESLRGLLAQCESARSELLGAADVLARERSRVTRTLADLAEPKPALAPN
jgi:hypothetical protein